MLTTQEKIDLAAWLIQRKAAWILNEVKRYQAQEDKEAASRALQYAVFDIDDVFDGHEVAPDAQWMRDFFKLTGDHAVLTEDGWMEAVHAEGYEVLEEINAPK